LEKALLDQIDYLFISEGKAKRDLYVEEKVDGTRLRRYQTETHKFSRGTRDRGIDWAV